MVAGAARAGVLTTRAAGVATVLYRVLLLNFLVAAAKIVLGVTTGAVSMLSDGLRMTAFPQIKDAIIHIEPPPKSSE